MEKQPHSPEHADISAQERARAELLSRHVQKLENHLLTRWFDVAKTRKLLKKVQRDVGNEALGRKAHILAVGYTFDPSGYLDPTPQVIDSEEARLQGVEIHSLEGDDRALLAYNIYDPNDSTSMSPYCVPPSALVYAEVDQTRQHQLFQWIDNNRCLAQTMVAETDFFHLHPDQQHILLRKKVSDELMADIGLEYDESVPVTLSCTSYYQYGYGDVQPVDWEACRYEKGSLTGTIIDAVYLESLQDNQPHLREQSDFIYGQGLPCLIVTSDEQETISFVPTAAITSFGSEFDTL